MRYYWIAILLLIGCSSLPSVKECRIEVDGKWDTGPGVLCTTAADCDSNYLFKNYNVDCMDSKYVKAEKTCDTPLAFGESAEACVDGKMYVTEGVYNFYKSVLSDIMGVNKREQPACAMSTMECLSSDRSSTSVTIFGVNSKDQDIKILGEGATIEGCSSVAMSSAEGFPISVANSGEFTLTLTCPEELKGRIVFSFVYQGESELPHLVEGYVD